MRRRWHETALVVLWLVLTYAGLWWAAVHAQV